MALATRCPQCGTTFKVAHDQLKLRAGMVRCGACKQVFNGIEHLVRNQADEVIAPKALSTPVPPLTPPAPTPTLAPIATPAPSPVPSATPAPTIPPAPTVTPAPTVPPAPTVTPKPTVVPKPTPAPTVSPLPNNVPTTAPSSAPLTTPAPSRRPAAEPTAQYVAAPADAFPALQQDSKLVLEHIDAAPPPLDFTPGNTLVEEFKPSVKTRPAPMLDDGSTLPPIAIVPAAADLVSTESASAPTETHELASERSEPTFDAGELASDIEQEAARKHAELDVRANQDGSDAEEPDFVKRGRRSRGVQRVVNAAMATLSLLLFFAALGQAAYAFRNQLAASLPASKPWLEKACTYLNCKVGLPVQIKAVSLEADELQTLPRVKNMFALSTLLRNHSATPQSWPYIELSLNDANDKVLARRVFAPRDYLANPQDEGRGFAANGEQAVKLYFELSQIKASGYLVYLFYP